MWSFLDALLCQSTPKSKCLTKSEKIYIGPGQQTTFGNCGECEELGNPRTPSKNGFCLRVEAVWTFLQISPSIAKIPNNLTQFGRPAPVFCSPGPDWAVFLKHWVAIGNGGPTQPTQTEPSRVRHSQSGQQKPLPAPKRQAFCQFNLVDVHIYIYIYIYIYMGIQASGFLGI